MNIQPQPQRHVTFFPASSPATGHNRFPSFKISSKPSLHTFQRTHDASFVRHRHAEQVYGAGLGCSRCDVSASDFRRLLCRGVLSPEAQPRPTAMVFLHHFPDPNLQALRLRLFLASFSSEASLYLRMDWYRYFGKWFGAYRLGYLFAPMWFCFLIDFELLCRRADFRKLSGIYDDFSWLYSLSRYRIMYEDRVYSDNLMFLISDVSFLELWSVIAS